jgi:hypothetical protein
VNFSSATLRGGRLYCMLIIGEQHLRSLVFGYQAHCSTVWPYQGVALAYPPANLTLLAPP